VSQFGERPRVVRVELLGLEVSCGQKRGERDVTGVPKIIGELVPIVRERLTNIGEDGVLTLSVESNVAASGETRESVGDRAVDLGAGPARERAEAINESEAAVCITDEIKNGKARLAFFVSKAAPELL
jgi:hypothetical protein